jgi:serine/threonine protein phosphatase 1
LNSGLFANPKTLSDLRISMSKRKIIVSDIHGCAYTFRVLINQQVKLTQEDHLYLLGDYIDRGPDSKGVIDFILELQEDGYQVSCLRGNHEDMLLKAYDGDGNTANIWRMNGGDKTMESFGLMYQIRDIPAKYITFLKNLHYFFDLEDCVLVHAGLNFKVEDPLQDLFSVMWLRHWYKNLNRDWLGNRIIIHGHTPKPKRDIESMFYNLGSQPILNIDAGCYIYGDLCAFDLTNGKLYFQENLDMED